MIISHTVPYVLEVASQVCLTHVKMLVCFLCSKLFPFIINYECKTVRNACLVYVDITR